MSTDKKTELPREVLIKQHIQTIQSLESQKSAIQEDIKHQYQTAKDLGLDPKVLKAAIKALKQTKSERDEMDRQVEDYIQAVINP